MYRTNDNHPPETPRPHDYPSEEYAGRPEMIIVFMMFSLSGFLMGLLVGAVVF